MKSSNFYLSVALYSCDELVTLVSNITSLLQHVGICVSLACQIKSQKVSTPLESEHTHGPTYICIHRNIRPSPFQDSCWICSDPLFCVQVFHPCLFSLSVWCTLYLTDLIVSLFALSFAWNWRLDIVRRRHLFLYPCSVSVNDMFAAKWDEGGMAFDMNSPSVFLFLNDPNG